MDELLFIIAAAAGAGVCYFYFLKMNKSLKANLNEAKQNLVKQQKISSEELKNLEYELELKSSALKKSRDESEFTEDRIDDLNFKVSKLEKSNEFLKAENEKLISTKKEYEMLFNARKDEIEKLKSQFNK